MGSGIQSRYSDMYRHVSSDTNAAITARSQKDVDTTVSDLTQAFSDVKVIGVAADALALSELERLVKVVNDRLGDIDVLVCNAGTNSMSQGVSQLQWLICSFHAFHNDKGGGLVVLA